ncbi:MAG: glycosyltransferase family 4 protein [Anaerolineae bacterium]|nr:glycosyltransferase family 4 protein [Anaerolineae bacterium]
MHVCLNALLLSGAESYRSAGVHHYVAHLLRYLPGAGCRLTALLGPDSPAPGDGYTVRRARWPTARPAVRVAWEQIALPGAVRRTGVDLLHAPAFVAPLLTSIPTVVTIHDLSFLRFPHLFRPANRLYLSALTKASARRARRVIAVSSHAAEEAVRLLGVSRERVDVVYHGVDSDFRPLPPETVAAFRAQRQLPERFVLFVGTLEPRKNVVRLVEAFQRLSDDGLRLVLAGGRGWYDDAIFERVAALGMQERVIFPGYVPVEELPLWYNAATVFAYPSLYEGFGMPVTEAAACGTPVLTSNTSSLPEAAGDGAVLVDPTDVDALADGLHRLSTDASLREDMRRRGLAHARTLTWEQTAARTLSVYQRAVFGNGQDYGP